MTKLFRPPCPRCKFMRMRKLHGKLELKCPDCGYHTKISDPGLRLWRNSHLADLRRRLNVTPQEGGSDGRQVGFGK